MGKIRATTIGSEEEAKQKEKRDRQREEKKLREKSGETEVKNDKKEEKEIAASPSAPRNDKEEPKKKVMRKKQEVKERSPRYKTNLSVREKNKVYSIKEAISLLEKMQKAKFDETVELHINTNDKLNGSVVLPHGTGKKTRVAILAPGKDAAGAEKLLGEIEKGKIDFDILIATPDAMPKLGKVARVLGPRGLMPNPKNGTITTKPEEAAKKYEGGQLNYKTETKANVVHISVGKMSFGSEKLLQNLDTFLASLDNSKVKSIFVKCTMSPSLKLK